ncbi:DUF92 domain-containing protein [Mucilaginibacter aquariorum]|uniref:DUF92 domain-containing protein n=1 Tax=Mucilaginibacter aquariorum TaxID=2967225 RepID=A0ABT1SWK7_9SPHI|nr:DUF92 domain-containing protein [Mucilaginibacter aquariorum]MCQ6956578.1 DUF92 domain-containing protein [Mucilaginibacter aquariorum]
MPLTYIIFAIILLTACYASYKTDKLTGSGAITGGVVAFCIYMGTGFTGITMLAAFFVLATIATSHKKNAKNKLGDGQHPEKRDARQVLANGGVPAILGLLAFILPENALLATVLTAAALASATADTLSSELGTVYGKRFYNIITFKPDEKGRDGVISLEGTLIGIVGAAVIAAVYAIVFGWNSMFLYIIIAGAVGNIADSVLGATLERKGYINNNEVNFLNTFVASIVCCLLTYYS